MKLMLYLISILSITGYYNLYVSLWQKDGGKSDIPTRPRASRIRTFLVVDVSSSLSLSFLIPLTVHSFAASVFDHIECGNEVGIVSVVNIHKKAYEGDLCTGRTATRKKSPSKRNETQKEPNKKAKKNNHITKYFGADLGDSVVFFFALRKNGRPLREYTTEIN